MAAIPQDLQKLIAGGAGKTAAPGPSPMSAAAPGNTPPPGGPMTTPQPKAGVTQAALVNMAAVFKLLEQSLPAFGSQTEQGKCVIDVLGKLGKCFGETRQRADELIPAELNQLIKNAPGQGPMGKAMAATPPSQPAVPGA